MCATTSDMRGAGARACVRRGCAAPRAGALLAAAAALALALPGGGAARADTVYLEGGGKIHGEIIQDSPTQVVIRTPSGSTHVISRDEIARIERDADPEQQFVARAKALGAGDANGFYELGKWARSRGLKARAEEAFAKAVEIEPDHAGAREALGHRKYKGRWYDEVGYKKAVEGLVEWNGRWVTPADKELYEQGFVKNDKGEWVRKEDLERQQAEARAERERGAAPLPRREQPEAGVKPAEPKEKALPKARRVDVEPEDTAWYDDHTTVMTWEEALKKPIESQYYRICSNIKPEYVKRYGRMLDLYSLKFRRVFNAKENIYGGEKNIPKGTIWIYPDHDSFKRGEHMGDGVGGYYLPGQNRVVCYHGRFGGTGTTRTVLVHEATHQFEDFVLPYKMWNAPVWVIEGFAVFFESALWDGKKVNIGAVPHDRLQNMKMAIQSGEYIRLRDLIRTPQAAFTGLHYAHAWSLIYFMLYGAPSEKLRTHNQKIFSDLFFLARSKQVTPEDVEEKFGGREAFLAFEERWKQWILNLPYEFDPESDADAYNAPEREKDRERGGAEGGGAGDGTETPDPGDPDKN